MSKLKLCTVNPNLEAIIKFLYEDDTTKEITIKENQLLNDVVYLDGGETQTVSGKVNVINFTSKSCTTGKDGCIHNDTSVFSQYVNITSLILDCSDKYNCNVITIPIKNIKDIGSVEDIIVNTVIIDGVEYATFIEALEAASNGSTITIKTDIKFKEKTTIAEDKVVIIDLNENKLVIPTVENNYGMVVKGDLTINGNGGNITVGMYGIGIHDNGKLTINGGNYKTTGTYLIGSWGETTINDGNFTSPYCTVNGFQGNVIINGGNFTSFNTEENTVILGNVKVTGGTFNQPITEQYCAEGYRPKDNGDGTYTVEKIEVL